ncbi:tripartite motif-containing protein 16-like [Stegastes partitus]|uniref:Tripartite motif-containing protein 16-like n=1 Tax=Stegastes partitus TaxID=144197 RepID=A0A9Y4NGA2_9TELE|nr:PREDICTED: tripartite motif-containing protein 16-like [Stegastes partitus]
MDLEKLSCSICLDLLKDPVTIPCGHSYCMNCIRSHWDEEDQKETHSCPQCRQTFRPRPDLVRNTMFADLVEEVKKTRLQSAPADLCYAGPGDVSCDFCTGRKLKAVKSCLQCLVSYCEQHLQPHYDVAALKKHKLVDPSRKLEENICSRHNEVMKIFCRTDQQCICYLCLMDEHKGHDTVSAAAERKDKQRELAANRDKIQQRIKEKENSVKVLQQEIAELRRISSELEQLSHTEDHIQFLHNYTLLSAASDARPVKHTEGVAAAVSDTTDELQDFLAEEESSQMAQLSDEKRKEYPKTRHEFFKYSCKTTLDPSTAHEYIQLEGKFKAKNSFVRKLPHPDRFTDWPQVLCRENMTGRHYWEVEWKGPEVFIVVSSKSISRSGAESAFGNNNISWALQCFCDGYEFRCNNYRTYIPGPPSSRIGVYLDLDLQKRGLHSILSFYSITDTMTLIHRVQDTFNWQLCLGFGLSEGASVEICKLSKA